MSCAHIDTEWFRRTVMEHNIARWREAAVTDSGFFRTDLDRTWQPAAKQQGTLVSQSRLLFVFATGWELTGDEAYRQIIADGAEFLLRHFRDDIHGGYIWQVGPDGQVQEDYKSSYGHAFVVFGLAWASRATGESRYAEASRRCWEDMKAHLRDEYGGILPQTDRDFSNPTLPNNQNPMMHLFEALLSLHDTTGDADVLADARGVGEFIHTRLFDSEGGFLPEFYDGRWRRLDVADGGKVDVGHQLEWAFLLDWAGRSGLDGEWLANGPRMMEWGLAAGYDREEGGLWSPADYAGQRLHAHLGWWEQCELLRTLMRYAACRGREDLWEPYRQSLAFVRRHFLDADCGGWFQRHTPGEEPSEAQMSKGSNWKVGYHVTGMLREALRIGGVLEG